MRLYDYVLSPSCYRVRLLAALVGAPLELRPVDFHPGAEHRGPDLRALNPAGTLPIFEDGALILTESTAILTYLAALHAPDWLGGGTPEARARTAQWIAFAHRLTDTAGAARIHDVLGGPGDIGALRAGAVTALRELEAALSSGRRRGQSFLVGDGPTIADIACFPHVALAPDGGVTLDAYPSIRLWMRAVRSLPGFIEMPGIHRLHELLPEPGPQPEIARVGRDFG